MHPSRPRARSVKGRAAGAFSSYRGGMEEGPEAAEGNYPYRDKTYRLVEADSERWDVFDADIYLGVLVALRSEDRSGPLYTLDFAGEENRYDEPATDDWRLVLEYLIDHADESNPDRPGHNEPAGTPTF